MEHISDNLNILATHEPEARPYQKIYAGGEWHPCLIIDGPDMDGYNLASRVVLDAPRALKLLEFLQQHKEAFESLAEKEG